MMELYQHGAVNFDAVPYIASHGDLKSRPHLARNFKLNRLSLGEGYDEMPPV